MNHRSRVILLTCFCLFIQAAIPLGFMPSSVGVFQLCPSYSLYQLAQDSHHDHTSHEHTSHESSHKAKTSCDWSLGLIDTVLASKPIDVHIRLSHMTLPSATIVLQGFQASNAQRIRGPPHPFFS